MAAPIGTEVREGVETMRDAMIEFLLIRVGFGVGFTDAFGDDFGEAALVAEILAVLTLHPGGVLEELAAERTAHHGVELLVHELVPVLLLDLLFALTHRAFAAQAHIESGLAPVFLG